MTRESHCIGVARKMKELTLKENPTNKNYAEEMYVLGLMHDMGYEFETEDKDHAEVGGEILRRLGYKHWKEVREHGNPSSLYRSKELDLLNKADMLIDGKGNDVGIAGRVTDIGNRYGKQSIEYTNSVKLAELLKLI